MRTKGSVIHFKSRRKPWIFVVKRWNLKISDKEFSMYLFHLAYEFLNHKLSNENLLKKRTRVMSDPGIMTLWAWFYVYTLNTIRKRALDSHCLEIEIWNFWICIYICTSFILLPRSIINNAFFIDCSPDLLRQSNLVETFV